MDIKPIDDNTWRFIDDESTCFLLNGKDKAIFIDGGSGKGEILAPSAHLTEHTPSLLNTASVSCLLGSNDSFSSFSMSPSDTFLYFNRLKRVGVVNPLFDGDIIDLGDRKLEIISFPGVTPGSVVVLDYLSGAVFGGLSITDFVVDLSEDYSDLHAYMMSVKRIASYRDRFDVIYPARGRSVVSPSLLGHLENTARLILRHETEGKEKDGKLYYTDGLVTFALSSGGER